MTRSRRSIRSLAIALAAACCMASGAGAQGRPTSISSAELRRSNAERLYDAVAQLRPDWLLLGADTSAAGAEERVLVYVDGKHVGDLRALRGIRTDEVRAVRLHGAEYVRRTDPRFPRTGFVAALFVASIPFETPPPPPGQVTLSLYGGIHILGIATSVTSELAELGFDQRFGHTPSHTVKFDEPDRAVPPAAGASVLVSLRDRLGVEVAVEHTFPGQVGRFAQHGEFIAGAASARFSSWDGAFMATLGRPRYRLALGPALRYATVTWSNGVCRCTAPEETRIFAPGVAALAVAPFPVHLGPVSTHFRIMGRYHLPQEAPYSRLTGTPEVGGFTLGVGIGLQSRL